MSLTSGRGPLSGRPAGRFTTAVPDRTTYLEPHRRRVRGLKGGATVVDSERVVLVHRPGHPPVYAFPSADVDGVPAEAAPEAPGYVTVDWDDADEWLEEDERVFGHPRNPYHRVDCLRSHRHLVVILDGITLVDTTSTLVVYETALDPRIYVEPRFVRTDLLETSSTQTYCPYKGTATYWSARTGTDLFEDIAWSYEDPRPESLPLGRLLSFDDTRVEVRHDLPSAV
ncbi:MAG TPA: DUF427 domain-containing protein [Acidimicrobiales bacterium]|nr:DUF427 domain-containing protein [Acidimicrobiales bacterium]